jgi:hypothetical protein
MLALSASDEIWMLRYAAEDVQVRIDGNRSTLETSSKMLTLGRGFALAAAPIGVIVFAIISFGMAGLLFILKGWLGGGRSGMEIGAGCGLGWIGCGAGFGCLGSVFICAHLSLSSRVWLFRGLS